MEKYVCIHGHFYQPPRENPWLEELAQRLLLDQLMRETWRDIEASFRHIYERNLSIMQLMREVNMPLPQALAAPAEFVIHRELRRVICADRIDAKRLRDVMDQATRLGIRFDRDRLRYEVSLKVNGLAKRWENRPNCIRRLQALESALHALAGLSDQLDLQAARNVLFSLSKSHLPGKEGPARAGDGAAAKWSECFKAVARHLRVALES